MKKRVTAVMLGLCLVVLPTTGCSVSRRIFGSNDRKEAIERQQEELKKQAEELQKQKDELKKQTEELKKEQENKQPEKPTDTKENSQSVTKSETGSIVKKTDSQTKVQTGVKADTLEAYMEMVPGVKEGLSGMMASLQNEQMSFSMEIKGNTIRMILTMKMELDDTMSAAMKSGLEASFQAQQSSLKTQLAGLSKQSGLTGLAYEIQVLKQDGSELLKMLIEQD